MYTAVRVTLSLPSDIANSIIDAARAPAERQGRLADWLTTSRRWHIGDVNRRGYTAVSTLMTLPAQMVELSLLSDNAHHHRLALRAAAHFDTLLFVSAVLAPPDAPAIERAGIPLSDFYAAQESMDAIALEWNDDVRIRLAAAPVEMAI